MVKKSRGGQTFNSSAENGKNLKSVKLKKKKLGAILIEVAFTLPVVVYLMFFCIELIKINITKEALQSICEEATYLTIAHDYKDGQDLVTKINGIVEKYRPSFIPQKAKEYTSADSDVIRWTYESYPDFSDMLATEPYGGSTVTYPRYEEDEYAAAHGGQSYSSSTRFIPANNKEAPANPEHYIETKDFMLGSGLPNNRLFILTVTCNYPFSSGMVKMLFGGGSNTKLMTVAGNVAPKNVTSSYKDGKMYLLWARGAGIVNPK